MKSSFLLILSLMTGCDCLSERKTCKEEWVKFTCNNPKTNGKCQMAHAVGDQSTIKKIPLKLTIKNTNSNPLSGRDELEFEVETNGCPKPFYQNVYKKDKTTIRCDLPDNYEHYFFCKQNNSFCEIVSSPKYDQSSKVKFSDTKTKSGFNVSSQESGVYWCGIKSADENDKFLLKQIRLKVITNFTRSPTIGQNFSYWCKYDDDSSLTKFICKGENQSMCRPLVNTTNTKMNMKFSMNDDKTNKTVTITVREVTVNDSGTYWCGAESTNKQRYFIHKLFVTVVSPTPATSTSTSTVVEVATAAAGTHGVSEVIIYVIICVAVLMLFLIILIANYKRFSCSKNTENDAATHYTKEDCTYEEMQECLQPADSENATYTIYSTVNTPSHAASTHYATINFQNSDKAGGEASKPSSSACEYSTVKITECPTNSSVTQLHQASEEPLYSTVNKSRKK